MARRFSNSCSSRIGTSSFSALLTLDAPGEEPATTAVVLRGPEPNSEVLAQQAFGLDLTDSPRYVVELYLNGHLLPENESVQATSVNRSVYQPGRAQTVTKLRAGENCARAVFYPFAEGPNSPRRGEVRWCFRAA